MNWLGELKGCDVDDSDDSDDMNDNTANCDDFFTRPWYWSCT